jgi:hypothetical protein
MSILSSIGSAISGAISSVVKTVSSGISSVGSALSGSSSKTSSSSSSSMKSSSGGSSSGGTTSLAGSNLGNALGVSQTSNAFGQGTSSSSMGTGGGTYNSSTGVYTDNSGQSFSTNQAPQGATVISSNGSSMKNAPQSSMQSVQPQLNSLDYVSLAGKQLAAGDIAGAWNSILKGTTAPYAPKAENEAALKTLANIGMFAIPVGGVGKVAVGAEGLLGKSVAEIEAMSKTAGTMEALGKLAMVEGGPKIIASTIPEAAGVIKTTPAVGEVVTNTKNVETGINAVKNLLFGSAKKTTGTLAVGGIIYAMTGGKAADNAITDYIKDSSSLIVSLRDKGLNDAADALAASNKDLRDGFDLVLPWIPIIGMLELKKVNSYRDMLTEAQSEYTTKVNADNKFAADTNLRVRMGEDVSVEDLQRAAQLDPNGAAAKALADMMSAINNPQEQGATAAPAIEPEVPIESPPTINEGASTLGFGLLHTGGVNSPANKNSLSQAIYGKSYDSLTAEEKAFIDDQMSTAGEGGTLSPQDQIAMYLFNKMYAELDEEQKTVVDKW